MNQYNVLVIGSGGREHTLAWALTRSSQVKQVYVAPGNGGTAWAANPAAQSLQPRAGSDNVPIGTEDFPALVAFARDHEVVLTVVGPEVPLAAGIVDAFQAAGLLIFGPCRACAQLEGSKTFAKDFMSEQGIPTAEYGIFDDYEAARRFLRAFGRPAVVKADGLAAGKGVIVCDTVEEAGAALHQIMVERAFGDAGSRVVIEERLSGREISVLAFCDGKTIVPMPVSRDHKRVYDHDEGPNTGGMGAFTPTPDVSQAQIDEVCRTVLQPAVKGMAARGTPYRGVLYAGIMLAADGIKVLEFNCRFGDPETQVILPLLAADLFDVCRACAEGRLDQIDVSWLPQACATVVLAAPGYPAAYPKGLPISGLEACAALDNVIVFHAGTALHDGQLVTSGGRVLAVTAIGADLPQALSRAYAGVDLIHFEKKHFRRDIGKQYAGGSI